MQNMLSRVLVLFIVALFAIPAIAQENVDLSVIHRIKNEAFQRSEVTDLMFYLTDVHGPRLTGSPGYVAAAKWAVERLGEWGMANAQLDSWGEFGRSWSYSRLTVQMLEPVSTPLNGVPMAWCSGTDGPVTGEVILAPVSRGQGRFARFNLQESAVEKYIEEHTGKLTGKVVLMAGAREFEPATKPASQRWDEDKLASLAEAPEPVPLPPFEDMDKLPSDPHARWRMLQNAPPAVRERYFEKRKKTREKLGAFLAEEGVAAVLWVDSRGDGSIIFAEEAGSYKMGAPIPPPTIVIAPEQYNRIVRLVEKEIPVKLEVDLSVHSPEEAVEGLNVVAEIPGGSKKDEVVMLGAHMDSWHGGTGAADNAAGSAVAMEALRILKALNLRMDRTVRLALWGGEEQGFLGSRGYVKKHFGDRDTMVLQPEHGKLAAYFNVDNGSGKLRGIYLQQNEMVRPIFEAWFEPFEDLGATTITIRNTGGTDHLPFDAVGLPGFQFIQDPLDYETRTHHSTLDVNDHIQPGDLMQASAILASFVYNAATRDAMLPRKPLPKPSPQEKESTTDQP
jgi:hypothetical protein